MSKNGKTPGNARTAPFGDGDGAIDRVKKGTDFTNNSRGQTRIAGSEQNQPPSRTQPTASEKPDQGHEPFRPDRAQTPTTMTERCAPQSIAADRSPHPIAKSSRGTTGSIGNDSRPFKNMKG